MSEEGTAVAQGAAGGAKAGGQAGPIGAVIGAILGAGIGMGTGNNMKRARVNLENTIAEYMNQLQALDMPRYEDLKLSLERYAKGEALSPDQLQALQELDSEVSKISQDKTAKQTQLDALAAMKIRARGGLTLQDKADLQEAKRDIDRQQSGVQKSIIQNMQARGQGGSGAELAARLSAGQQGAQMASQNSLATAARAQQAAMQSLKDSASLGRQIGQDQLDFDKMKAQSIDDTRRRNLERMQAAMQYNIGNQNAAKQANWDRANKVADANVNLGNQEQQYNKNLLMADYNNQKNRLAEIYTGEFGRIGEKEKTLKRRQDEHQGYIDMINSLGSMGMPSGGGSGGSGGTSFAGLQGDKGSGGGILGGGMLA